MTGAIPGETVINKYYETPGDDRNWVSSSDDDSFLVSDDDYSTSDDSEWV